MSYYSYTRLEKTIGLERLSKKFPKRIIVIMGFQRSGTSLTSRLFAENGGFFGKTNRLIGPAITNPHGFYEHKKIQKLSWNYLSQCGIEGEFDRTKTFHPKGIKKILRLITVYKMHLELMKLSRRANDRVVCIKLFPIQYYAWKSYLGNHDIVGIYREPFSSVSSFLDVWWPDKYNFYRGLELWNDAQTDLMYHLARNEGNNVLLSYEALLGNPDGYFKRMTKNILEINPSNKLDTKKIIDNRLNRSVNKSESIKSTYGEYPEFISKTLERLNSLHHKYKKRNSA